MTELPLQYKVSPSQGPFRFHAWLELPFPLAIKVDQIFEVDYREGIAIEAQMVLQSNIYKVVTGSWWQQSQEMEEWVVRKRAGEESPLPHGWVFEYVSMDELSTFVAELRDAEHTRYVHVESVPAVAYLCANVPDGVVPDDDFVPYDLAPGRGFFSEKVLLHLHSIVDAYRIAAYPWMRYSIAPVSEAMIDEVIMNFTDKDGRKLGRTHYGFDPKSPHFKITTVLEKLQNRFDSIFPQLGMLQAENQMASSYFLYRMRRWAEAVAVASSVVEGLQRDLVFQLASSEIEAKAIWRAYRYKDQFNKVFPAFGKPKLSKTDPALWEAFVRAMEYRGAKVHGDHPEPFDHAQREIVKQHLQAFHNVAWWLCQQMGHSWALNVTDEGEVLAPFP
jgi:hypothetical protein